jgi:CheY-like chemotaxis protein
MWGKTPRPIPLVPEPVRGSPTIPDTLAKWIPDPSLLPDPIDVAELADARPLPGPQTPPAADQTSGPVEPSCRVLLVDDRQERRALTRMVVETGPAGTSVVAEASTVSAAVAALDRHNPDVAVVEIGTRAPKGLAVIIALRARHPSLVIVVCSFRADPATQRAAALAGANAYLTKPFSPRDLLSACRTPVTAPPDAPVKPPDDYRPGVARSDADMTVTSSRSPAVSNSNRPTVEAA